MGKFINGTKSPNYTYGEPLLRRYWQFIILLILIIFIIIFNLPERKDRNFIIGDFRIKNTIFQMEFDGKNASCFRRSLESLSKSDRHHLRIETKDHTFYLDYFDGYKITANINDLNVPREVCQVAHATVRRLTMQENFPGK